MTLAVCDCSARHRPYYHYVHEASCPFESVEPVYPVQSHVPILPYADDVLVGTPRRNRTRKTPKPPAYRLRIQFNFTRPINIDLWKRIEAPPGWRKCPTSKTAQQKYWGVRFQCDDYSQALSPDELSLLHMKLLMCLEGTF